MPGIRGRSHHDLGLFEAHQAGLLGFNFEPQANGFFDALERLFTGLALRMAAGKIGAAHRPAFLRFEECNPVAHRIS